MIIFHESKGSCNILQIFESTAVSLLKRLLVEMCSEPDELNFGVNSAVKLRCFFGKVQLPS